MKAEQIIAIAGGSGCGKTWLAQRLIAALAGPVVLLSMDWYYKDLSNQSRSLAAQTNFDHPDAIELDLFIEQLDMLARGEPIEAPIYEFSIFSRNPKTHSVHPGQTLIVEGLHTLWHSEIRQRLTHSIYVDYPSHLCLARRIRRDHRERGYPPRVVLEMWASRTSPMFHKYVEPTREFAQTIWNPIESDPKADRLIASLQIKNRR